MPCLGFTGQEEDGESDTREAGTSYQDPAWSDLVNSLLQMEKPEPWEMTRNGHRQFFQGRKQLFSRNHLQMGGIVHAAHWKLNAQWEHREAWAMDDFPIGE